MKNKGENVALLPCKECGAQVSTSAKTCPQCGVGAPTRQANVKGSSWLTRPITFGRTLKIVLALMFIGGVSNVMLSARKSVGSGHSQSSTIKQDAQPVDACFDQGYNGATVYMANLRTATEVGALASEAMNAICSAAVQKIGSPDCRGQCEAGFRYKAKN